MRWLLVVLCGCGRFGFEANVDAPSDVAPSDGGFGCKPSYELCDGFEGTTFDPQWMVGTNVELDSTVAHRGSSSLHTFSDPLTAGDGGEFSLDETATLGLGDPTFYVRAYVMLSAMPANNMRVIDAGQVSGFPKEDAVFINPGEMTVYSQFADASETTNQPPPLGSWFCVLWTVDRAQLSTGGSLSLAGDPPMIILDHVQTDATPKISKMGFGIGFAFTTDLFDQPRVDVWIDDVIIAASPLTCAD